MSNKNVFLDRDGVINKYPGDTKYVTSLEEFRFLPKAKAALALLRKHGYRVFVVSNQAGVGKGCYSRESLDEITLVMKRQIEKAGGALSGVYYCVHKPDANCSCRKPLPGLVHRAQQEHSLTLKGSFFVGDTIRDVAAAKAAGCSSILVLSGKEKLSNRRSWDPVPDFVFKNLFAAAVFITREGG